MDLFRPSLGCAAAITGAMAMSTPQGQKAINDIARKITDQCKTDDPDPCEEIRRQIRDIQAKRAGKEGQLAKDPYDLYKPCLRIKSRW